MTQEDAQYGTGQVLSREMLEKKSGTDETAESGSVSDSQESDTPADSQETSDRQ